MFEAIAIIVSFVASTFYIASAAPSPGCAVTMLYVIRGDTGLIEGYCGTASKPLLQFPLRTRLTVSGFGHDGRGNIIILQTEYSEGGPGASYLTAYSPDGRFIATSSRLEGVFGLAIDETRGRAYVYSPERSDGSILGTTTSYARSIGRFATFDTDSLRPTGFVAADQIKSASDFFVDRDAMLWIYDVTDRGLYSLRRRLPYNTCAIAPGPNATLSAISCEGILRTFGEASEGLLEQRDLGIGPVFGGLEAELAVGSSGSVYLYNAYKHSLSCYARGSSKASSTVSNAGYVHQLLVSRDDDVYVRGFASNHPSITVYHGCGLKFVHRYLFYAERMTLVPPPPRSR